MTPASTAMRSKTRAGDLAAFGGAPMYEVPISTSNLVQPDIERFLAWSRVFHDAHRYTNDGPVLKALEQRLAEFHGTRHCVATSNGF